MFWKLKMHCKIFAMLYNEDIKNLNGVAGGISPTVFWGFLELLLKALVRLLHSCSLKQSQSVAIPSHLPH